MVGTQAAGVVQAAAACMAVLSFGLVLDIPGKYLGWSGAAGAICWVVYILVKGAAGSTVWAVFLSSLAVALIGHLLARILRAPVSVFLIPGILPLVPGTSIYHCVYHIIWSNKEQSTYYLVETMQIAGAIAMAVFLMDSIFKMIKGKRKNAERWKRETVGKEENKK